MMSYRCAIPAGLALVAMLASSSVLAQSVYKWTDANGVVHYSDQPPAAGSQAVERVNLSAPRPSTAPRAAELTGADAAAAVAAAPPRASDACTTARQNLVVFANNQRILMDRDGDGTPEELSETEREQELARTQRLVDVVCSDGPAQ